MTGDELRSRVDRLGMPYTEAAQRLGLSLAGLHHQMRDMRPVSRQTEIILGYLERDHARRSRRRQQSGAAGARELAVRRGA